MKFNKTIIKIAVCLSLLVLILIAVPFCYKYYKYYEYTHLPKVAISMQHKLISDNDVEVFWMVRNDSEKNITFKSNNIQLCTLDGNSYETAENLPDTIIKPNEKYEYTFKIENLSPGFHSIAMTAKCEEGTSGTFKGRIQIEY